MKRSILGLAGMVLLALAPEVCRAGMITMTISLGASTLTIFPGSPDALPGSDNTSLQVNLTTLNKFLSSNGSAFQFSSLGATSNFPGTSDSGTLSESGFAISSGIGNPSITISTVLSGYIAPTGSDGTLSSTDTTVLTNTTFGDTQTSNSSFDGFNTTPHTFTSTGPGLQAPQAVVTPQDVGAVNFGYELDASVTLSMFSGSDVFDVAAKVSTTAGAAAPEPASLTSLSIGSLVLLGYGWRRRKSTAV
jgi:hypothetical protein